MKQKGVINHDSHVAPSQRFQTGKEHTPNASDVERASREFGRIEAAATILYGLHHRVA
jgi:hypothetical protein